MPCRSANAWPAAGVAFARRPPARRQSAHRTSGANGDPSRRCAAPPPPDRCHRPDWCRSGEPRRAPVDWCCQWRPSPAPVRAGTADRDETRPPRQRPRRDRSGSFPGVASAPDRPGGNRFASCARRRRSGHRSGHHATAWPDNRHQHRRAMPNRPRSGHRTPVLVGWMAWTWVHYHPEAQHQLAVFGHGDPGHENSPESPCAGRLLRRPGVT